MERDRKPIYIYKPIHTILTIIKNPAASEKKKAEACFLIINYF